MEAASQELLPILATVSVKATVLLLLAALAARLRGGPAADRALLWAAALAGLLLLPAATPWRLGPQLPWGGAWKATPSPAPGAAVLAVVSPQAPAISSVSALPPPPSKSLPLASAVMGVYLAGVVIGLGRIFYGWVETQRLRRTARPHTQAQSRLEAWKVRLGIKGPVALAVSPQVDTPALIGWRRPLILVPAGLAPRYLDAVLAHELAHLRRGDPWWNLAGLLAAALYWYLPLAHWARRQWRQESERACDEWATWHLGDARAYGRALLAVAAAGQPGWSGALRLGMARRPGVADRVERLLQRPLSPPAGRRTALATLALVGLATGCIGGTHLQDEPAVLADHRQPSKQADRTELHGAAADSSLRIRIPANGRLRLNGEAITLEELQVRARQLQQTAGTRRVVIQPDVNAQIDLVARVMDAARRGGLTDQVIAGSFPPSGALAEFEDRLSSAAFGDRQQLPSQAAASPVTADTAVLRINADGAMALDGRPVKFHLAGLDKALTATRQSLGAKALLVIQAQSDVPHGMVVQAMDIARRAGIANLRLATE